MCNVSNLKVENPLNNISRGKKEKTNTSEQKEKNYCKGSLKKKRQIHPKSASIKSP